MNLIDEIAKRKNKLTGEVAQLAYNRYQICKQVESCQKQIAEIDDAIAMREAILGENECARKDCETYLAIEVAKQETKE